MQGGVNRRTGKADIPVLVCTAVTKGSGVDKQDLIFPVSQHNFLPLAFNLLALFVVAHDPQSYGDIRGIEHLSRQYDNRFNLLILNQLLADFVFLGISAQSAVLAKRNAAVPLQESRASICRIQA